MKRLTFGAAGHGDPSVISDPSQQVKEVAELFTEIRNVTVRAQNNAAMVFFVIRRGWQSQEHLSKSQDVLNSPPYHEVRLGIPKLETKTPVDFAVMDHPIKLGDDGEGARVMTGFDVRSMAGCK